MFGSKEYKQERQTHTHTHGVVEEIVADTMTDGGAQCLCTAEEWSCQQWWMERQVITD